ncbi:SGNH/GDSL hydrolase family protein [bacterium]|nr:SGNH/GDSL hydrolase family protein [bacterium]
MIARYIKLFGKYLSLIGFGIIFSLFLLEVGLRTIGVQPATYLRKFSQYHDVLGWEKKPDVEGYFQRGDVKIHEKLNSKGLRSTDYGYDKPENTYRILFLGDSFTEGYDVEFESLFTTIIENQLNKYYKDAIRIEVINAGTGGYSNDQEYLFYRLEGYKYSPDLVIMMIYPTNDVYYNSQTKYGNYYKPKFAIQNDTLILANTPLPEPPSSESFKDLFRELAIYQFILNNVLSKMPNVTAFLGSSGLVSVETAEMATQKGRAPASFSIYDRKYASATDTAWTITKEILRATKKTIEKLGSNFLLFSIPDKFQIYDPTWTATQQSYKVNDTLWDRSKPETILAEFCRKEKIAYINFLDSLKIENSETTGLYNGVHWNELGNDKAAEVILKTIISNSYIKVKN